MVIHDLAKVFKPICDSACFGGKFEKAPDDIQRFFEL